MTLYATKVFFEKQDALYVKGNSFAATWCLDSGATSYMCGQLRDFTEIDDSKRSKLNLANHTSTMILAKGTVDFESEVHGEKKNVNLSEVFHVPDLRTNLISVAKITDRGFEVIFKKNHAEVIDRRGAVKLHANRIGNLYYICEREQAECSAIFEREEDGRFSSLLEIWHRRMGHLNV
ncbi:uncharacterized protein LOC143342789 [Colletes latitarsis]|uniref:uncharacterized protein LOC143342789 n=1 Tax=Colletes latitarsis TaxID=2605962 RepID=UPI0040354A70